MMFGMIFVNKLTIIKLHKIRNYITHKTKIP